MFVCFGDSQAIISKQTSHLDPREITTGQERSNIYRIVLIGLLNLEFHDTLFSHAPVCFCPRNGADAGFLDLILAPIPSVHLAIRLYFSHITNASILLAQLLYSFATWTLPKTRFSCA